MIPEPTLSRLPWYLACVARLSATGVENVSSTEISRRTNVDASQIAKDLSFIGIKGRTRIGYRVVDLEERLSDFLGFRLSHNALIAGAGSLGCALIADRGLQRFGLNIVAAIDTNPELIGTEREGVTIYSPAALAEVVKQKQIEIGIITVPVDCAQEVADRLSEAGVKALWNFTPLRIIPHGDVIVQDTSIYAHLAVMYHRLTSPDK